MTALSENTPREARAGIEFSDPVAAAAEIFAGALVCLDTSGNAIPGDTIANGAAVVRGVAMTHADNGSGAAGDVRVTSRRGLWRFANSASTDAITRAEIGDAAYVVDDSTVAKTDATSTRIKAGTIRDVNDAGVWVEI